MEDASDEDSYDSFFNINLNQYPNLTANFSIETSPDLAHHHHHHQPLLQTSSHHQPEYGAQQQLPKQPFRPSSQQQQQHFSPVNVNLLSFQPLPRDTTSEMTFSPPMETSAIANTASAILSQNMMSNSPALQHQDQPFRNSKSALGPGLTTPPPLPQLVMSSSAISTFPTPTTAKEAKPRKPRTPKKATPAPSSATETPVSSSGSNFKNLKEFVSRLLQKQAEQFADKDFAERAILNLARKISSRPQDLVEWGRAVNNADHNSGCVTIPRPKDGRMTVTKTTGGGACKKVFPQILVCQIFRWPHIVFHHDIRSSETCLHPATIKPAIILPGSHDDHPDVSYDVICINPYHYVISAEAEARFRKANAKTEKLAKLALKQTPLIQASHPGPQSLLKKPPALKKPEIMEVDLTGFESDSSDVSSAATSDDDDGIDYVKKWEEEAVKPDQALSTVHSFDEEKMIKEIKFLTFDENLKQFLDVDDTLLQDLKVKEEIKDLIFSGKLVEKLFDTGKIEAPRKLDSNSTDIATVKSKNDDEILFERVSPKVVASPMERSPHKTALASASAVETENASPRQGVNSPKDFNVSFEMSPEAEDDTSIRDILADIQDSYERQLDEEFNDIPNDDQFVEPSFFNPSVLEIDPTVAASELPCIVNSWTVPDQGSGQVDDFSSRYFSAPQQQNSFMAQNPNDGSNSFHDFQYQPF